MANKEKPISVLLIDNEKSYCEALVNRGRQHRIIIDYEHNFEDGFTKLNSRPRYYHALIIDARCYENAEAQAQNVESEDEVFSVKNRVDEFCKMHERPLCWCINTGYESDFGNRLRKMGMDVFSKANQEEMLGWIWEKSQREREIVLRNEHPDIFELFENGDLNGARANEFVELLNEFEYNSSEKMTACLSRARRLLEEVFNLLRQRGVLPATLFPNERCNHTWCSIYLSGKEVRQNGIGPTIEPAHTPPIAPEYIQASIRLVLENASEAGAHVGTCTNYTVRSVTYALLDILFWLKKII